MFVLLEWNRGTFDLWKSQESEDYASLWRSFYGGIFTNTESNDKKYFKQMPETLATVIAYLDVKV